MNGTAWWMLVYIVAAFAVFMFVLLIGWWVGSSLQHRFRGAAYAKGRGEPAIPWVALYEAAKRTGGGKRVTECAVVRLIDGGHLQIAPDGRLTALKGRHIYGVERAAFDAVAGGRDTVRSLRSEPTPDLAWEIRRLRRSRVDRAALGPEVPEVAVVVMEKGFAGVSDPSLRAALQGNAKESGWVGDPLDQVGGGPVM